MEDFIESEMNLHPFYPKLDLKILNDWQCRRGGELSLREDLPKLGWTCSYKGLLVAAAFIRKCEGGIGIFDSLICDPLVAFKIRNECIDHLVHKIILESKNQGLTKLIAFSLNARTLERSERFGFIKQNHILISKIID
jgi:hypothetical protein